LQRHSNSSCPIAMPYYNKTVNYLPERSVNYLGGLYTVPARALLGIGEAWKSPPGGCAPLRKHTH
ncbi:MAG: hypothetical protein LBL96_10125, partial [Clostridiales bacterium]|nr:hypothetical protein [Clostridiales bacterium]